MFSNPKTGRPHDITEFANDKKEIIERLSKSFKTYLSFDQRSDNRFHDPSPNNSKHWKNVNYDANKLAEIAYKQLYL